MTRNPLAVSFAVWRAIFLREALERLFDMRFAWFWLLAEPIIHIAFLGFVRTVIRLRTIGNADALVWIMLGLLAFFLFRRTANQVTYAVESNQPLFVYRQVKPFDPVVARAVLEALLMTIISSVILTAAAFLGYKVLPNNPLLVMQAVFGLWLFGIGYGLVASAMMVFVQEMDHILKILMMPLYLISGVIWPIASVPQPYQDILMINPIVHALEFVRLGFFPYYHSVPNISMTYLYGWVVASIFLGLMLYRRFSDELVMK